MIRINLLPTRETRALRRRRCTIMVGAAALCVTVGALAAVNVSQLRRRSALEAELAEGRRAAEELRLRTGEVKELEETIPRQRERNHAVREWLERRAQHPRILRGLSAAAPDRLWLTRYAESQGAATLEGRAADDESIARFLRNLSDAFHTRELLEVGKAEGGQGVRRFVIRATNEPQPRDAAPAGE